MNNTFTLVLGDTHLPFDLVESPVVDLWKQILLDAKEYNCPLAFSARPFGEDLQVLSDRLSSTINILSNDHNFVLPNWSGVNNGEINQLELNCLHEQFHRQEDELSRVVTQTTVGDDEELLKLLNTLNVTIHAIEASSANFKYAVGSIDYEHVKYIPNEKLRLPISDDVREYFSGLPLNTKLPFDHTFYMELGYHTIGKNVRMCCVDNDSALISENLNSPQLKISSEFNLMLTRFDAKLYNQEETNFKIKNWLSENNLNDYIDMEDPKNKYNLQPLLGTCSVDLNLVKKLILTDARITDFYFS
jgi:hypothetical protein